MQDRDHIVGCYCCGNPGGRMSAYMIPARVQDDAQATGWICLHRYGEVSVKKGFNAKDHLADYQPWGFKRLQLFHRAQSLDRTPPTFVTPLGLNRCFCCPAAILSEAGEFAIAGTADIRRQEIEASFRTLWNGVVRPLPSKSLSSISAAEAR